MPSDVTLRQGWLERDVKKAADRVVEWSKSDRTVIKSQRDNAEPIQGRSISDRALTDKSK